MNTIISKVKIYTDGSCLKNPGPGGWAAILHYSDKNKQIVEKVIQGGKADTTNNQMELTAAIEALLILKKPCQVDLYTDSKYVINGITSWMKNWLKNNWKNSSNKPVQNAGLWKKLQSAAATHKITWHWVKGHSGHCLNDRVDEYAKNQATKIKNSS